MNATDRRTFLAAGGLGAALLLSGGEKAYAEKVDAYTGAEAANVKVVNDFCASWASLDADKIGGFLAEKATFRMIETTPRMEGRDTIVNGIKGFIATAKSAEFEVLRTQAMGSIVINERIDHFDMGETKNAFHIVGIFFVKDGMIQEWQDYTMPKKD
ncbi:MAG: limonene-1,2-epoxide hydrolase family protein [Candidatus Hydrogenedentota bacterium]